jgi:hypothetical protein
MVFVVEKKTTLPSGLIIPILSIHKSVLTREYFVGGIPVSSRVAI